MPYIADRVKETSTSTGTGAITLLGAVSQFRSFATAFGTGTTLVGNVVPVPNAVANDLN